MENETFNESTREKLFGFILQDRFDERYVQKDGTQKLRDALVFGCAGLMLTALIVALIALVVHSGGIS